MRITTDGAVTLGAHHPIRNAIAYRQSLDPHSFCTRFRSACPLGRPQRPPPPHSELASYLLATHKSGLVVGLCPVKYVRCELARPVGGAGSQVMAATLRARMAERRERQAQVLPHECRPGVCQLSSASSDGFGHQFDAKLSCIAVAHRIGMRYVHVPFRGNAHGESSLAPLEALVGLNQSFWTGRTSAGLRWNWRQRAAPAWWPAPYGRRGACSGKPYLYSWLLLMDLARHNASAHRPALCCTNVLYTNDVRRAGLERQPSRLKIDLPLTRASPALHRSAT